MNKKEYAKFCKDIKSDILSDNPEGVNDSIYYEIAQCALETYPELKKFMLKEFDRPDHILIEILADDVASARG